MLEAIGAGVTPRVGDRDWKEIWLESPEFEKVKREIQDIKVAGLARPAEDKSKITSYATPFWFQLGEVVKRNSIALWRSPEYIFTRLFVCTSISFFVALAFLQLGNNTRDLQYRVFAIFWLIILPIIVMTQIEPLFIFNRSIFIRESSSRMYSSYVFAIGQLLGEIPYNILCGLLYWVLMVYPIGFGQGTYGLTGTGFQLLIILFLFLFGISLGQLIAATSPSMQVSLYVVGSLLILLCLSGCCALQPLSHMVFGHFLRHNSPLSYINQFLEELDISVKSLHPHDGCCGVN
ncbi:hypothetical protein AX14_013219 [Amanita brunnescens Koide BX004]|nr:hypothetical protein AX14_013219 [Amanita brunnescens Koide BX004]